jgi:hypothetical protein
MAVHGLPLALVHFAHGRIAFDSQASRLKRLGLLQPAEAKLPRAAFEAENVEGAKPGEVL